MRLTGRVLIAVRSGCQTSDQVRERIGMGTPRTISNALRDLHAAGDIESISKQGNRNVWAPMSRNRKIGPQPTLVNRFLMAPAGVVPAEETP
ncbi:hypothetical protein C1141_19850 [Vibrio agarivorans]|nr:hypothetical protein C1141_19850 [Vibrio agarivorans]